MNSIVQNSQKAIQLRRLGHSYSDIAKELKVSRTSVCNWVKNVRLSESEKHILQKMIANKMARAKMQSSISLRARKVFKEKVSYENAEKNFGRNMKDPIFSIGLGLYCAKGSLTGGNIQFIHKNELLVKIMLVWLEKYLKIPKNKLNYRPYSRNMANNKDSFIITISSIDGLRTIISWQKLLMKVL